MNKGFTLVELLAAIVILSLIVLIAVPSYNRISDAINSNHRKNLISDIEISASKYAFDTSKTMIFVDELVTEGYIESDEEGNIIDPVNNGRLNCYIVEMNKQGDYYNAKFIDGKNYDNNGVCDLSKLQESSENVNIEVLNGSEFVSDTSIWLTGSLSLRATSNTLAIDCTNNRCSWTSSSGASYTGTDNVILDNISTILETKYTFQYTIYDDNTSEIKRYNQSVNLKIDNESPVIYENEINVTNRFVYTSSKNVTISASDGKGSGISGYYLGLYTGESCNSSNIKSKYQTSNKFTISSNGTYQICVKDNVGNVSSYNSLKINYIS